MRLLCKPKVWFEIEITDAHLKSESKSSWELITKLINPETSTNTPLNHLNPQSWTSVDFCWPEEFFLAKTLFEPYWAYENLQMIHVS